MNVAIVGSRTFNDYELVISEILKLEVPLEEIKIISGGAKGADTLGEKFADENLCEKLIIKPDWERFGRAAGMIRNKDIVECSDVVIAFWDGQSKGTKNSIDLAKKMNKKLIIVKYDKSI